MQVDLGSNPRLGRSPGEGNGNPLQYPCLGNLMDSGACSPWGRKESGTTERLILTYFSSVAQSCLIFCDPVNGSTPGLPVHHQFPEFIQAHIHQVGDTMQPSHPLSSPSPPAPNPSQHQGLFKWVISSQEVAKVLGVWASASVLPMNTQDWSPIGWTSWISL